MFSIILFGIQSTFCQRTGDGDHIADVPRRGPRQSRDRLLPIAAGATESLLQSIMST